MGQTSSVTPARATSSSTRGSSTHRTPWPIRSAPRSCRHWATLRAPRSSPPWGTLASPARRAMPNAAAKSPVSPRRSSLDNPNPTTPRPAYCTARRASVRASSGWRVRLAAITTPMPIPARCSASRTASSTRSVNAVIPPNRAPYPDGSTWISVHTEPSAASSSAASSTSRRTSSSVRSTERATSYNRWKRNQPFSSVATSSGGHCSVRALGSEMWSRSASSTSVAWRIEPVKCRWRWALGRPATWRMGPTARPWSPTGV